MICAGIDAGSRAIKIVLFDPETRTVVQCGLADQGPDQDVRAQALLETLLAQANRTRVDIARTVATGYARAIVRGADTTITEITCHARGVHHVAPEARTVIEIGGQDSKLLHLDSHGAVRDFSMNDRCAAGTGRFLEVVVQRLEVPLAALGEIVGGGCSPAPISSMCVVFAETEIIGLMASGRPHADILAGVQAAIASRIASMVGRKAAAPVVFTGGVALVPGMDRALSAALEQPVSVVPDPQMTGALGAALLAAEA